MFDHQDKSVINLFYFLSPFLMDLSSSPSPSPSWDWTSLAQPPPSAATSAPPPPSPSPAAAAAAASADRSLSERSQEDYRLMLFIASSRQGKNKGQS